MVRLVVVKLGGSLITNKDRPFSLNIPSMVKAINYLGRSGVKAFLVHGGGSFGHYQASRHGLGQEAVRRNAGVPETKASMQELDLWVLYVMMSSGLRPFPIPPQFIDWGLIERVAASGLTPVSYGDVYYDGLEAKIIGGDQIIEESVRNLDVERVVFALSVPGILKNLEDSSSIIEELREVPPFLKASSMDVTGGIRAKVETALRISKMGIDVAFVKGDTDEFIKALRGLPFRGTIVRGL